MVSISGTRSLPGVGVCPGWGLLCPGRGVGMSRGCEECGYVTSGGVSTHQPP